MTVIRRRECARCGCKIVAGNLCGFDCPLDNRDHGDETVVVEYVRADLHRGAVEQAERYGEAIVAISEALRGGYVTRARTIIASLDTGE